MRQGLRQTGARRISVQEARREDEVDAQVVRAAAWDQVCPGELSFDFAPHPSVARKRSRRSRPEKHAASIKDAIVRWLEEQI